MNMKCAYCIKNKEIPREAETLYSGYALCVTHLQTYLEEEQKNMDDMLKVALERRNRPF